MLVIDRGWRLGGSRHGGYEALSVKPHRRHGGSHRGCVGHPRRPCAPARRRQTSSPLCPTPGRREARCVERSELLTTRRHRASALPPPLRRRRRGGMGRGRGLSRASHRSKSKSTPPRPSPSPAAKGRGLKPKSCDLTREAAGRRAVAAPSEAGCRAPESGQDALIEGKAETARRTAARPKPQCPSATAPRSGETKRKPAARRASLHQARRISACARPRASRTTSR